MGYEWGYRWYGVKVQVVANLEGKEAVLQVLQVLQVQEEVWRLDSSGI